MFTNIYTYDITYNYDVLDYIISGIYNDDQLGLQLMKNLSTYTFQHWNCHSKNLDASFNIDQKF